MLFFWPSRADESLTHRSTESSVICISQREISSALSMSRFKEEKNDEEKSDYLPYCPGAGSSDRYWRYLCLSKSAQQSAPSHGHQADADRAHCTGRQRADDHRSGSDRLFDPQSASCASEDRKSVV